MYQCKNCGAGLSFDIASQKLKCNSCDSLCDPEEIKKESDGTGHQMEVNVFECPQCGGLLYSDDTSITEYCSFCGGHTVLTSRMQKENKPERIIPFKVTKESAKETYRKYLKGAIYAPDAIRKMEGDCELRPVYMPYWNYDCHQEYEAWLVDSKNTRNIPSNSKFYKTTLEVNYSDRVYDASSIFADELAFNIAPYNAKDVVEFTPSYLCGFYADIADVSPDVYRDSAMNYSGKRFIGSIAAEKGYEKSKLNTHGTIVKSHYKNELEKTSSVLLPVWLLSYRKGKRVAYGVVNGQTGVVDGDLPIDIAKFGVGCLVITALLFVLFTYVFTMKPVYLLVLSIAILSVIAMIYSKEIYDIFYNEHRFYDRGFQHMHGAEHKEAKEWADEQKRTEDYYEFGEGVAEFVTDSVETFKDEDAFIRSSIIVFYLIIIGFFVFVVNIFMQALPILVWGVEALVTVFAGSRAFKYLTRIKAIKGFGLIWGTVALIISGILIIVNPVHDVYYYMGTAATLLAILFLAIDLIHGYNVLATRPFPEFSRKRGKSHE